MASIAIQVPPTTLSPTAAKAYYDRFGAKQDAQGFYEDAALERLVDAISPTDAAAVFELGCGTGRFAESLLRERLPPTTRYYAADLSSTMVALSRVRLRPFASRALVLQTGATFELPIRHASVDRFVSTYVLDILSPAETRKLLAEARRILRPGGRLGLVSITAGTTVSSTLVMRLWRGVHRLSPRLVGGCRPIELGSALPSSDWRVEHRSVLVRWGWLPKFWWRSGWEPSREHPS